MSSALYSELRTIDQQISDIADERMARLNDVSTDTTFLPVRTMRDADLDELEARSITLFAEKRSILAQLEHGKGGDRGFASKSIQRCSVMGCQRTVTTAGRCQFHYQREWATGYMREPWTEEEDQKIRMMSRNGMTAQAIARHLGRNAGRVSFRIRALAEFEYKGGSGDVDAAG